MTFTDNGEDLDIDGLRLPHRLSQCGQVRRSDECLVGQRSGYLVSHIPGTTRDLL